MIPPITHDLLTQLDACDRGIALLNSPACPPLPLALADALALAARHIDTPDYEWLAPTMAGTMRWLTARLLLTADATPAELLRLHQPRLGIVVTAETHQTVVCASETLTVLIPPMGGASLGHAPAVSVELDADAHCQVHGALLVTARSMDTAPAPSIACVCPQARLSHLPTDEVLVTYHAGSGTWWNCGQTTKAPY